ncbi:hypothetical protein PTKIN_Ptkin18bG0067100 [Pterospermum kingtungense]
MDMRRDFLLVLLNTFAVAVVVIHAQNQSGINYISDEHYTQSGISKRVLPQHRTNMQQQMVYLRSFPEGERNCYNLTLRKGDRYGIKASFISDPSSPIELFAYLSCEYRERHSISALELRRLRNTTYTAGSMALLLRYDVCSTNTAVSRFSRDVYDRAWWPYQATDWTGKTTSSTIKTGENDYQPPSLAMQSGCEPANASQPLTFPINSTDPNAQYYAYMHFA